MNRIKAVLEGVHSNLELRQTIVPLFMSNPGLGKSFLVREFAEDRGINVVEFITSQRNPFEISGMAMPDRDTKKMSIWDFDTLLGMKDGDILFFDELLNGNPVVLNACLTLLESRRTISGKQLPKIMVVAASNPQGMCPLTPQIKERFVWYDLKYDKDMWIYYMIKKYDITYSIGKKLSDLIKNETFTTNNFYTPRSIDKAVNMITNGVHTPYESPVKVILEELVTNTSEKELSLRNGEVIGINESMSWLDIYKKNKIIK